MKKILMTLQLIILFSFSVFASNVDIPTTSAETEAPCYECEKYESSLEQENSENLNNLDKNIKKIELITNRVEDFFGSISVRIIDAETKNEETATLSEENNYKLTIPFAANKIQVIPSLDREYTYDFYVDSIVQETDSTGLLKITILVDYNLINTEQEDNAFETDSTYNEYISTLETISNDFGLSEDTQIENPNTAIKEKISEYELEKEESKTIKKNVNENVNLKITQISAIFFIVIILLIVLGFAAIAILRYKLEHDEDNG